MYSVPLNRNESESVCGDVDACKHYPGQTTGGGYFQIVAVAVAGFFSLVRTHTHTHTQTVPIQMATLSNSKSV